LFLFQEVSYRFLEPGVKVIAFIDMGQTIS